MIPLAGPRLPRWAWTIACCFLLAWNGLLAQYACPFTMTQTYDGAQYQLLARNRLAGHYETGAQAHTVRDEGAHPMWRPGLVWLIEGLARLVGTVHDAAWILSWLATTVMELALLWISWRCFGRVAWIAVLLALSLPLHASAVFLSLAFGQGPEPWAAVAVLGGWACWLKSCDSRSLLLATGAGVVLGGADWFRTGNLLLVAIPLATFAGAALVRRSRRDFLWCLPVVGGFAVMTILGSWLFTSPVDKTVANLWGNLVEHHGPQLIEQRETGPQTHFLGGLLLAPGTTETYYDYIVRSSGSPSELWQARRVEIPGLYFERLLETFTGGLFGVRQIAGETMLALALIALVSAAVWRDGRTVVILAFTAGFFAHYFGPVVLLRGDKPTHYLFVALPLLVVVAGGGVAATIEFLRALATDTKNFAPTPRRHKLVLAFTVAVAAMSAVPFYRGGLAYMQGEFHAARQEFADLDSLGLEGKKIAVRSMAWFADRRVSTVLCPYASISDLERYAVHHGLDGILLRTREKYQFFNTMPYDSFEEFERAMGQSDTFCRPRTAGAWKWFAVKRDSSTR